MTTFAASNFGLIGPFHDKYTDGKGVNPHRIRAQRKLCNTRPSARFPRFECSPERSEAGTVPTGPGQWFLSLRRRREYPSASEGEGGLLTPTLIKRVVSTSTPGRCFPQRPPPPSLRSSGGVGRRNSRSAHGHERTGREETKQVAKRTKTLIRSKSVR